MQVDQSIDISVVITVYNEEENVAPLVKELRAALHNYRYELVYVDDGSTDGTIPALKKLAGDDLVLVELRRNYGQSAALAAGIDTARGQYIATMDGDLQNDPNDIPMMLELAKNEDWDLVTGIRAKRQDGMLLRKIPSKIANRLIRKVTGIHIKDLGCALKVFKSNIAKEINLYGELHRFIAILAHFNGARIKQVPVNHRSRQFGTSKYGLGRTLKVASDLLLMQFMNQYMLRPMHLFAGTGVLLMGTGILINLYLLVIKLMGNDIWGKPILFLGVLALIVGLQLITVGIIVEYQMRTYFESQDKKPYIIRKIYSAQASHMS